MFPLPLYSVWPYTPVIPAFYWNAKSTEEIIKHLACEQDHIIKYLDVQTNAINSIISDMTSFKQNIETRVKNMEQQVQQLLDALENVGDNMVMYDPTQGTYTDTKTATRNLYRELAVFGARVTQIADKTVDELSKHRVDETSAVGNLTIFNNPTPRVTNPETGTPYPPIS